MEDRFSKQSGIYKWTFPNGKIYVGKARKFSERYSRYIYDIKKSENRPVIDALNYFGIKNCKFEIIELTGKMPSSEVLFRESLWIKFYNSAIPLKGYNMCTYSADCSGLKASLETRNKMSEIKTGKSNPISVEGRKRISETHKGKFMSPETRLKLRLHNLGKKASKEAKLKMGVARKKRDMSFLRKSVNQLDLNGKLVRTFPSITAAAQFFDKSHLSGISYAIRKSQNMYNYKWEFAKKENN